MCASPLYITRRKKKQDWLTYKVDMFSPDGHFNIEELSHSMHTSFQTGSDASLTYASYNPKQSIHPENDHASRSSAMFPLSPYSHMTTSTISEGCVLVNESFMNCSFRNLSNVPMGTNYTHVTRLDLQNNIIETLANYSFINYPNLEKLDLSSNNLKTLAQKCFYGLDKLKNLSLQNNPLCMNDVTFHNELFSPLSSLETLVMNRIIPAENLSNPDVNYPDKALAKLRNLTELRLDGNYNVTFGEGFRNLTSLRHLILGGYMEGNCRIFTLRDNTFFNVPNLTYLDVSSCYIDGKHISPVAFSPLTQLQILNLTHNEDIDIDNLKKVFNGLHNITTLRELKMHLIVNRYSLGICLDSQSIDNFPRYLEIFDAQENNLEAVDRQVIQKLSPSLKILNLSGNKFVFGTYLKDLKHMTNLTELYLNGGSFTYSLPAQFPYELKKSYPSKNNCTLYGDKYNNGIDFLIELPPNLVKLEMNGAGLKYRLTKFSVSKNNLKKLYLQNNNFPSLEGPIYGLNTLLCLDLSHSLVKSIEVNFFDNFYSLHVLNLSNNILGDFFEGNINTLVFSSLTNLRILDLSSNSIRTLHTEMFINLTELRHLYLTDNILKIFNVDISSIWKLKTLDISKTRISQIPKDTRLFIDQLGKNITINMAKCDISCECENLPFLSWMIKSDAFDKSFLNYQCVFSEDSTWKTIQDGYNSTVEMLQRKCTPHAILFFLVGSSTVVVFFILLSGIVYRFRWKIRYLYYAAYLHYKKSPEKDGVSFKYDAFVSYDHSDEEIIVLQVCQELESRGLKLCVHGRDFKAGDYIASNVVKAVCSSRKTLVILTRNMMNSYWCKYEIQMANMESIHTGRRVLIFLLVEKIPESELGVELLYNIRNNTYIPYPTNSGDSTVLNAMWNKLASDIKD
ncbi:hypothetical protein Btru_004219 [Bulinus truncatus]|nr:hypothetical protein Btru_004219 [Bulinus truncatus]